MEAIVFFALILVVAIKGFTTHSIHALESKIRAAQSDEAEVSERLQNTESSLRALEKEHKALEQELKHLENDKDLATLEVAKAGGKPLTEEQFEQLLNATSTPRNKTTQPPAQQSGSNTQNPSEQPVDATPDSASPETQKNAQQQESGSPNTQTKQSQDETTKRARILVVDDNDELRSLLLQALSKEYEVLEAPDGFEALSQILKQKEKYDLVITDLNMPKVNGIQLLEHLPEGMPSIIISAFLNKPEFKKALAELKPTSVLEKPFQIATLRTAVQQALTT